MANSGSRDGTHHSIDILRVDAENARAVAVGGEIAGCDAPAKRLDAQSGALGCLGEGFVGPGSQVAPFTYQKGETWTPAVMPTL